MSFPPLTAFSGLTQWATTANYPAGTEPWAASPTKVAPGYTYLTPGVSPGATELNSLFSEWTAGINTGSGGSGLLAQFAPTLGQYWPWSGVGYSPSGSDQLLNEAVWDSVNSQWIYLATVAATGAPIVFRSPDGSHITAAGTTNAGFNLLAGVAVEPSAGTIVVYDMQLPQFRYSTDMGNTFSTGSSTLPSSANWSGVVPSPWSSFMVYFLGNFYLIACTYLSGNYSVKMWTAPAFGYGGSTVWTDRTSSLPSSFGGTTTTAPKFRYCVTGGALVVAASGLSAGGVKIAAIGTPTVVTDVSTNLPFPSGFAPNALNGLVYSAIEDRVVLSAGGSTGGSQLVSMPSATLFTTSSTGWTSDYTFTNAFVGGDLACCGALYFQTVPAGVTPGALHPVANCYVGTSRAAWGLANNYGGTVAQFGGSDYAAPGKIVCNGNQLLSTMQKHYLVTSPQGLPGSPNGASL